MLHARKAAFTPSKDESRAGYLYGFVYRSTASETQGTKTLLNPPLNGGNLCLIVIDVAILIRANMVCIMDTNTSVVVAMLRCFMVILPSLIIP